jgi:alkanesulfonate monooxygenase SsuD/methylene tetrahydromethanopterin reductase-like flavin-dependent oxidoreductase (luciferase family)
VSTPPTVGIYLPQVGFGAQDYLDRAAMVEELGFDSLWLYDHLSAPGQPGYDSFEAMTLAAWVLARTSRLRVGHLVTAAGFRNAGVLAKVLSSLDVLSGGRLEVGIGSGSIREEHEQVGLAWGTAAERSAVLAEVIEAVLALFGGEPVDFHGEHVRLSGFQALPRPIQQPRPPLHIGGIGPTYTLPLVARFADVWSVPTYGLATWREAKARLVECCEAIGRDPASLRISHEAVVVVGRTEAELASARSLAERRFGGAGWGLEAGGYLGTPDQLVEHLGAMGDEGVTDFIFFTPDRGGAETLATLALDVLGQLR